MRVKKTSKLQTAFTKKFGYGIYSHIRWGLFLEIAGSNWGARLIGEVCRDRK